MTWYGGCRLTFWSSCSFVLFEVRGRTIVSLIGVHPRSHPVRGRRGPNFLHFTTGEKSPGRGNLVRMGSPGPAEADERDVVVLAAAGGELLHDPDHTLGQAAGAVFLALDGVENPLHAQLLVV